MRALYCGNFEHDARQSDIERLFNRYGEVVRVDMKSGFAFIYMDDERDAEDAIRYLDNTEFGKQRRRICVEWTKKGDRESGRREGPRRFPMNLRPTKALFVINFDPVNTRVRDLERHFEPYGKLLHVRIRRNFAFVHYETQEEATKALESTNMSKVMDRVISVEYAERDDDDRRGGRSSPGRRGGNSSRPDRGSRYYGRSVSPVSGRHTERGRQDYGRASPVYGGYGERGSFNRRKVASPVYDRYRSRSPVRRSRS